VNYIDAYMSTLSEFTTLKIVKMRIMICSTDIVNRNPSPPIRQSRP